MVLTTKNKLLSDYLLSESVWLWVELETAVHRIGKHQPLRASFWLLYVLYVQEQ